MGHYFRSQYFCSYHQYSTCTLLLFTWWYWHKKSHWNAGKTQCIYLNHVFSCSACVFSIALPLHNNNFRNLFFSATCCFFHLYKSRLAQKSCQVSLQSLLNVSQTLLGWGGNFSVLNLLWHLLASKFLQSLFAMQGLHVGMELPCCWLRSSSLPHWLIA